MMPVTVAVNVTFWPNADGLSEETSVTLAAKLLTICNKAGDVEAAFPASPEYTAVNEYVPGDNRASRHVAVRLLPVPVKALALHNAVAPSKKVTVPVGVVPVTVAVKVTS